MKRNLSLLTLAFLTLWSYQSVAQQLKQCATDEATNEAMINNPDAVIARERLEQFTQEYTNQQNIAGSNKTQGSVYIIPIVFHILHTWGGENISDDQVYDAVRILNDDFRRLNADTTLVITSFENNIADVEMEFRLAHIDPNGNCTNGIERYYDPRTVWDRSSANNNGYNNYTHSWNSTKYLNIYVVKSIDGQAAAYTYLPGTWPSGSSRDAIVALHDYVGSIGTGSVNGSRTLTHEIGHWFNLQHTWGSTNQPGVSCGDDLVFDTPITKGSTVCNLALSDCNPPIIENVQNYMDYSYCNHMFTNGQRTRMRSAAASGTVGRNNLWSVTNLAATGVSTSPTTCAPIPYLNYSKRTICEGNGTQFNHISMNLDTNPGANTFLWDFPGGTPSSSTLENPSITYNTAGDYDVTLTITNSGGTNSVTYTKMVSVYTPSASFFAPFAEGFELITFPGTDFDVDNLNNGNTWTQTSNAAATGTQSIYINNWGGNFGTDAFFTPSYSFSNVSSVGMTFKLAFAKRNANADDRLQVFSSTNCGSSWVQRYSKLATGAGTLGLATTTTINNFSSFVPIASAWRTETVTIGALANQPDVRFKFVYTYSTNGNYGNNIYVDDINLTGTVGINETLADEIGMWLSPNPTDKTANLSFTLMQQGNVIINVLDVTGRNCSNVDAGSLQPGEHNYQVGNNLSSGIYFVELINNGSKAIRKLVIE